MRSLPIVVAAGAGAIAGLLAYGLAPSHNVLWAIGATVVAIGGVLLSSFLTVRDEDRDPTIRPPNLPRDDRRTKQ